MNRKELRNIIKQKGEGNSRSIQTESSVLRKVFTEELKSRISHEGVKITRGRDREREKRKNEIAEDIIAFMCKKMESDPRFYFKKLDDLRERKNGRTEVKKNWCLPEKLQFNFSIRELFRLTLTANELYGRFGILQEVMVSFAAFHEYYGKDKWQMTMEKLRYYGHAESDLRYLDWLTHVDFLFISTSDSFQAKIRNVWKNKEGTGISSAFLREAGIEIEDVVNTVLTPKVLNRISLSDGNMARIFLSDSSTEMFGKTGKIPFDLDRKSVTMSLFKEKEQVNCLRANKCPFFMRCLRLSFQLAKKCAPLSQKRNQGTYKCLSCSGCEWTKIDAYVRRQGSILDKSKTSLMGSTLENSNVI